MYPNIDTVDPYTFGSLVILTAEIISTNQQMRIKYSLVSLKHEMLRKTNTNWITVMSPNRNLKTFAILS